MLEQLQQYLTLPFVQRALVAGVLIALCAALLGVTLVLKRLSFIGDGLSHVAFGAMAVAGALNFTDNMVLSLPVTIVCANLLLRAGSGAKVKGDAALAMLSAGAMAFGYLLMNVFPSSSNISGDVCTTLFGSVSILTLTPGETWLCVALAGGVAAFQLLAYHRLFDLAFDADFARVSGTPVTLFNILAATVVAVVIVISMRLVGTLLVSALLVFPAISALRVCQSFFAVTLCSAVLAVGCALAGILVSVMAGTPVGSTIVAANTVVFLSFCLIGKWRS